MLDATQRLRIPHELLNLNMRNIVFRLNHHHTFVWPRNIKNEYFHSRMLSFYLDEEAFEKEVISWCWHGGRPRVQGFNSTPKKP
jgi:hypothetical protein